jgi:hypothetical protein
MNLDFQTVPRWKKVLLGAGVGLLGLFAVMLLLRPSPMPPVRSVTGTITEINGDVVTVERQKETETEESAFFQFRVVGTTAVTRQSQPIPYLFQEPVSPPVTALSLKDLEVGSMVTVSTQSDLRKKSRETAEAEYVNLPMAANSFEGRILRTAGNTLTVSGTIGGAEVQSFLALSIQGKTPEEKTFTVTITPATEISYIQPLANPNDKAEPKKLTANQLTSGMNIRVYTTANIAKDTNVQALRIEPLNVDLPTSSQP